MTDIPINATIRPGDLPVVKLEGATLEQVEAAALPTRPFDDEIKAEILAIAATGKRVHLMACPGTRFIANARSYRAFPSSKAAFGWSIGQAMAV